MSDANGDMDAAYAARAAAANPQLVTEDMVTQTAQCAASAFLDDPVLTWFLRDDKHFATALFHLMETNTRRSMASGGAYVASDGKCTSLWFPPDSNGGSASIMEQLKLMPRFLGLTGWSRIGRLFKLISLMEKNHPHEPHQYLQVLGVEQDSQGMGLGSSILSYSLTKNDAEGMPSYLENSKEKNTPFYERHGFKIIGEINMPNGPTMWPMWRNVGGA